MNRARSRRVSQRRRPRQSGWRSGRETGGVWPQGPTEKCFQREAAARRWRALRLLGSSSPHRGSQATFSAGPRLTTCSRGVPFWRVSVPSACGVFFRAFLMIQSHLVYMFSCLLPSSPTECKLHESKDRACVTASCRTPSSYPLGTQCLFNEKSSLLRNVQCIDAFS